MLFGDKSGALDVCRNWIKETAENKTKNWKEQMDEDNDDVISEYSHFTQKTQGKVVYFLGAILG
jgi:hypothetical protein